MKIARLLVIASMLATMAGTSAAPTAPRGKGWSTTGSVLVPDAPAQAALCEWLNDPSRAQGTLGHMITLRAAGAYDFQEFALEGTNDGIMNADHGHARLARPAFAVTFFGPDPGTCAEPNPIGRVEPRGRAGDRTGGWMPFGARYALVLRRAVSVRGLGLCYGGPCGKAVTRVNASDETGPEPFRFTIHRSTW